MGTGAVRDHHAPPRPPSSAVPALSFVPIAPTLALVCLRRCRRPSWSRRGSRQDCARRSVQMTLTLWRCARRMPSRTASGARRDRDRMRMRMRHTCGTAGRRSGKEGRRWGGRAGPPEAMRNGMREAGAEGAKAGERKTGSVMGDQREVPSARIERTGNGARDERGLPPTRIAAVERVSYRAGPVPASGIVACPRKENGTHNDGRFVPVKRAWFR